jgi:hypothetical protein
MPNFTPTLPEMVKITEENKKDFNRLRTCLSDLKLKLVKSKITPDEIKEITEQIKEVKKEMGKLYLLSIDKEIFNKLGGMKK